MGRAPGRRGDVIWRSGRNPIITRAAVPGANSIFNSAVVPFGDGFAGVFRCDNTARDMQLHAGMSRDGVTWAIEPQRIQFRCKDPELARFLYGYDPRVCWLEDRYYVTWCNGYHGPTIGVGYTHDFVTFYQMENAFLPYNRNGVLFPRRIGAKYAMLSRPSDTGHTPFGDIFYSESPGPHPLGLPPARHGTRRWLASHQGRRRANADRNLGRVAHVLPRRADVVQWIRLQFRRRALDLEKPWQVMRRTRPYLLNPRETYECVGDVPNVTFPCAALVDPPTGRVAIYYGGADTVTCLAFGRFDELMDFVVENSM